MNSSVLAAAISFVLEGSDLRLRIICGMSGAEAPDQDGGADRAQGEQQFFHLSLLSL